MTFSTRGNDNNNRNGAREIHEYIPPVIKLLRWDGTLDADKNPVRQLEVIHDPEHGGVEGEAERVFDSLNMNFKFATSQDRFHGGHRQKLWALYNMRHGDWDAKKRGGDKWRKYSAILQGANLQDIDWRTATEGEVYIVALSKRNPETNAAKYTGVCVFTEDSEQGKELMRRLEIGAKKKRDYQQRPPQQAHASQPVQQNQDQPAEVVKPQEEYQAVQGDNFVNTPTVSELNPEKSPRKKRARDTHTYGFPLREAKQSPRGSISSAKE